MLSFELLLTHLDSAYNLARWLARNEEDAERLVELAFARAMHRLPPGAVRIALLALVHQAAHERSGGEPADAVPDAPRGTVADALAALPVRAREVLVLRELEGLGYGDIAEVMGLPAGLVPTLLSQARAALRRAVTRRPPCPSFSGEARRST
jgi:RNA polymerase sigma-70 factor (ECF subfamily)